MAYQLIEGSKVYRNVRHGAQKILPNNERQIRPLTSLPVLAQLIVWEEAVKSAPKGRITAKYVKQCVQDFQNRNESSPHPSCWNCRYSSSELIKNEPDSFYCDQYGKLNTLEKNGAQRAESCESYAYRFEDKTPKPKLETFSVTLQLPKKLQPLIKNLAQSKGVKIQQWAIAILEEAICQG